MDVEVCNGVTLIDLTDPCIRALWTSFLPSALVFGLLFVQFIIPTFPKPILRFIRWLRTPFHRYLKLDEAEASSLDAVKAGGGVIEGDPTQAANRVYVGGENNKEATIPLWRTLIFTIVGLLESLGWLTIASFRFVTDPHPTNGKEFWFEVLGPLGIAIAWLYTAVRPVARPTATPPFDSFALYVLFMLGGIVKVGEMLYSHLVLGLDWPSEWKVGLEVLDLSVVLVLVVLVLVMPLNIPSSQIKKEEVGLSISPEDYTSLLGWITFAWVYPLVQRGRNTTLNEKDVWALSPTIQSRPVFMKFSTLPQVTLLRKLWAANSFDLTLDFVLTFVSVVFNYMGPFFLKRILDLIDLKHPTPESRSRAYIYAFLAFTCSVLKSEADVQHLWFGRRAATRTRSELMASIYDKALKRKDFSGIIDKAKTEEAKQKADDAERDRREASEASTDSKTRKKEQKEQKKRKVKEEKERAAKADDPKAGADVGKIVNLMAGDANKISNMISGAYFIYGAPFEIIIAGTFLYQLMGLSAFAGFFVLLLGWPLNSFIARRSIRIQKGVLAARDKRMGVLNELIGAIKLIKFFAWEDKWIDRAMDARSFEMKWFVKARINSVMFYMLWTCAPILVSIISFFVYVYQGNELTISVAFTAIALFGMMRAPLNVIPAWIVQILQTGVALKRIAVYLEEDEVPDQVSSLKKDAKPHSTWSTQRDVEADQLESGLGIVHGTFKWNEIEEKKDGDDKGKGKDTTSSRPIGHGKDVSSSSSRTVGKHGVSPTRSTETGSTLGDAETSSVTTAARVADDQEEEEGSPTSPASSNGSEEQKFELKDIHVLFPERELTVVTGPTASGKTALLMALLGEMTTLSGSIVMSKEPSNVDEYGYMHAISYSAQTPWLRHQSIKENILFGFPYEEERYNQTIECCALLPDLAVLEDGDQTEIGARGVSLSGGQKARVALARAVYARTKYVLLDDPLSAVDSHTARFLFDRLFRGPLLENRTVVLVTHHVELVLPGAYYLVRMLDGRIDTQGAVKDLRAQGALDDIVHDSGADAAEAEADIEVRVEDETGKEVAIPEEDTVTSPSGESPTVDNAAKKPRKLIKDEHRETGGVKWSIYKTYLRASSYWIWGFLGFIVLLNQLLGITEKLWIKTWGEAYGSNDLAPLYTFRSFATQEHGVQLDGFLTTHQFMHPHPSQNYNAVSSFRTDGLTYQTGLVESVTGFLGINFDWPKAQEHPLFYVGVYAAIGFTSALVSVISVTAQYTGALRASRILFKQLLVTVVRATFRFHDTTPQGRMLNRFGKDIETIDTSLAGSLQAVNSSLASFFASILTVAVIFPGFLIPAVLIGFAYRELAIGYLNTGRDLRRMESNTRSPIFSDFGELLEGIVTVRAFSAERRFLDNLHKRIDLTTQMWYSFWMTNRWLLLNFDFLGALAVLITTLFSISTLTNGAGFAGLCITSAMAFTTSVYWACRFWTGLELDLNSVERIVEYLDLPQEPPTRIEGHEVPAYWPSSARNDSLVSVENLTIKYAPDLPAVLSNVSFQLKAGERIGLLGRTGSGKSTLAMSILRFTDPTEGKIVIDGIDISTIGLYDLRSRLTFIPQDATLFSGTLKENLDPFNEHSEEECLDVLRRVQMISQSNHASRGTSRAQSPSSSSAPSRAQSVHELDREATAATTDTFYTAASSTSAASTSGASDTDSKPVITLDSQVSAGGTNFSQGQRQLIAMARALLRRSSIIVLDEATSSIDFNTDAKIQQTIREEFTDSLLLTVAHRLRTVIDYDRLLVLDKGQVVEFDTPYNLIRKDGGIFRQMCLKSGTYTELLGAAQAKAESG